MFFYRFYQKLKVIKRFNYILLVFFGAGFSAVLYKAGLKKHIPVSQRLNQKQKEVDQAVLAVKLRETLEKLGPIFVKFGQIFSTRFDLLPEAYISELEKLQYEVKIFPFKDAKKIIEKNLGKPLGQVYDNFETVPFASASLGQVYKARLKTGQQVAVKVQRPQAKEQIKLDVQVLLMLAHFAEKHIPGMKDHNLLRVVQEFQRWTINELDYRKEATNGEVFTNFFKDDKNVYSPKVY